MKRERTPKPLKEFSIRLDLAGPALSATVSVRETFDFQRSWKAAHDLVHEAEIDTNAYDSCTIQFVTDIAEYAVRR